jgi:tRNA(Ile)-lysidine synthase
MAPPAVARVLERIRAAAMEHDLFGPGGLVLVACSGGPDSTCLLHALARLHRLFRIRLAVFHFDHRLRKGSEEDGRYVRRQAERLGLPFELREAADAPARGQSPEAWARLARYAALTQVATDLGADRAALGHTLDDQAETVLLGLVRGGGLEAVAGMAPASGVPPLGLTAVRPLLETPREEIEAFCRTLRLRPRRDPTNEERRFLRNRIRKEILPLLERHLDRGVKAALARTAANVRLDAAYLDGLASDAAATAVAVEDDAVRVDVSALGGVPGPVASRVILQAIRLAAALQGGWVPDPGAVHVRGVIDLTTGRPGRRLDLPGGLLAVRAREYVRIARASPDAAPVERTLERPGRSRRRSRSPRRT